MTDTMTNKEAIDILRVINPPRERKRIFDEFMQARDMAISALEKQERSIAQNVNSTHRSRPNTLESLNILEQAKDDKGEIPMSLVRLAFRNILEQDRWIPCSEGLPKSDGKYLVTEQFSNAFPPEVNVLCFATDLSKVKSYVFEKGESGFYRYDDEWGYTKVNDVTAWREKPEPYRVEGEE